MPVTLKINRYLKSQTKLALKIQPIQRVKDKKKETGEPKQNVVILNPNALSSLTKQTYEWMKNKKNIIVSLLSANRICTYKRVDLFRADLHEIVVTHNRLSESLYCHDLFQRKK